MLLGTAALAVTFLFLNVLDYTEVYEFIDPGEEVTVKTKGRDISDAGGGDGAALLVWTVIAIGIAAICSLIGLIPSVARRIWVVAIPVAITVAGWAIYSQVWLNDDFKGRLGPGAELSKYGAIFVFAVAVVASIATWVRNRDAIWPPPPRPAAGPASDG